MIAITACLALLLGTAFVPCAAAEEDAASSREPADVSVALGLVTRHVNPGNDTNEKTNFVVVSYDRFSISRFKNSYNDETWFGGLNFRSAKLHLFEDSEFYLQGSLYPGILYGYGDHLPDLGGLTPIILPTAGLGYKRVCLELFYFPSPSGGGFSALLRFDLGGLLTGTKAGN